MRHVLFFIVLLFCTAYTAAEQAHDSPEPESPELPMPVQSGETLEPDITIIRRGKKTIQEYRVNGELYMIKIIPDIGPAYYMVDTDGDGSMDLRHSDLERDIRINQWKLFSW